MMICLLISCQHRQKVLEETDTMHMVITALVSAEDPKSAIAEARDIFEKLCYEGGPFDYFVTFDEEGHTVAGKDRWGDLTPAANTNTKEGKEMLESAMKATEENFIENIDKIRYLLSAHSNEDLLNEKDFIGIRYRSYCIGQYEGSNVWIYDSEGCGIRNRKELEWALEHIGEDGGVWAVIADVHF